MFSPRASGCAARHRLERGFTLLELLIVVAIIAILAALLLPVLSTAKSKGKQASCVNNLRQLSMCWRMYSADNNEKLVENDPTHPETDNWVLGSMKIALEATNELDLRQGLLFPYVSQVSLFHCPADSSQSNNHLRTRSYSMNGWMGTRYMETIRQTRYRTFVKENEIGAAGTATLWVVIDENESTIDDGWFQMNMDVNEPIVSAPATRHRQGYVLNFADSHVDYYKMRGSDPNGAAYPNFGAADWSRLRQVTTIQ
jgi:prepilin-type N-terminal cleavage/methylation domain-containing protein